MENCEYYQELMDRLMDEGLSPEEETDLREHLRACPDCARLFSALSAMTVTLREDQAEAPRVLTGRVMARIRADQAEVWEQQAEQEERPRRAHLRQAEKKPARAPALWVRAAAAACLVLLVGGVTVTALRGRLGGKGNSSQAASIRSADSAGVEMMAEGAAEEAADAAPAETPAPDLPVCDIAGDPIGYIPLENMAAFEAMLADAGPAGEGMEVLCTVTYDGVEYAFATDSEGEALAWWDPTDDEPHMSPGTWPELRALIVSTVDTEAGR